jgi:hypothetical protein
VRDRGVWCSSAKGLCAWRRLFVSSLPKFRPFPGGRVTLPARRCRAGAHSCATPPHGRPRVGSYRKQKHPGRISGRRDESPCPAVEDEGVAPDIEVIDYPHLIAQGQDPSLEKAVEVLLKALQKYPPKPIVAPPAPTHFRFD